MAAFPDDRYPANVVYFVGNCQRIKPAISDNRVTVSKVNICGLISEGYDLPEYLIMGAPDWMMKPDRSVYYDIQATVPEGFMARQAQILSRETNRPVIDKAGIDGGQVFELRWAVNGVDAHRSHCLRYSIQFRNSWAFVWNPTNRSFLRQTVREALQTEGFLFSLGREAFTLGLFSGRPQGRPSISASSM